jgi:hypothetical protein
MMGNFFWKLKPFIPVMRQKIYIIVYKCNNLRAENNRGGNRAGRVGFGLSGSGQFDLLEENRVGSIYILCFFRSLVDFDWIEGHLISGRVGSNRVRVGSDQFDFFKKSDRIEFGSGRIGRVSWVGSGSTNSRK